MTPSAPEPIAQSCYNCGAALHGPFCAACGQQAKPLDPRLGDVARDLTHELLDVDGRTVRSVRHLLLSPGLLTREYFEGRRVSWLPPLRLYLIFSLVYFAVVALTPAGMMDIQITSKAQTEAERLEAEVASLRQIGYNSRAELEQALTRAQVTWMPRVMFVLVPLFAWFVQVARRRDKRAYPQHLFFALHVHAVWFVCGAVMVATRIAQIGLIGQAIRGLVVLYGLVYLVLAIRTAYGGTLRRAVLHAMAVGGVYWIAAAVATLAIMLPTVFWHW